MDLNNITLFSAMGEKMKYHSQRQAVLAQNVANSDTPGYKAKDIAPVDFSQMVDNSGGGGQISVTHSGHMGGGGASSGSTFETVEQLSSADVTPTGNNVVLQEQMMEMGQNAYDYKTTTMLYKKMTALMMIAVDGGR